MEITSFSQQTGLGPLRKSYLGMGLRNGISLGIRKKHIRIGNKFDSVEWVISLSSTSEKHTKIIKKLQKFEFILGGGRST